MNVWKYIYIKFFKIRRRVIGKDGADDFAAMLFVAFLDMFLYFGILILIDRLVDNVLANHWMASQPFHVQRRCVRAHKERSRSGASEDALGDFVHPVYYICGSLFLVLLLCWQKWVEIFRTLVTTVITFNAK